MDEVDRANNYAQASTEAAVSAIRNKADMPVGYAGECDYCGEYSARLVNDACAPCRDKYGIG